MLGDYAKLTKSHSTQPSHDCQADNPPDGTLHREPEEKETQQQHHSRLHQHHQHLDYHVGEEDLGT